MRAFRIVDVQLNEGGFRSCRSLTGAGDVPSTAAEHEADYDNPSLGQRRCITARVTVQNDEAQMLVGDTLVRLRGNAEAWGVNGGGADRPVRAQAWYGLQFQPVQSSITFDAIAVTYYDETLDGPGSGGRGFADAREPSQIRSHLQGPGARVEFSVAGADAEPVTCVYRQGEAPGPDNLRCPTLEHQRIGGANRFPDRP